MITENGPSYSTRPVATLLLAFLLKGAIIATLFFFCIAVPLKYLYQSKFVIIHCGGFGRGRGRLPTRDA